ncbi:AraC family transcriptional regulator [Pedobacter gandavensis]|uniref:AraC family transcriptional regulator n=1 Tax=Pedobacter gandavensis TaxID=2679963 RepID=A0ABR6EQ67_9SPHI|nr:AraC family transcriptional regulator [Pedobacter gandavensis]MBB2147394.1 AraC family transcriptional regulator [Pedobacter gandavensis]
MENIKHEDDFFEKKHITVPAAVINEYVKNKFFRNALYTTEIGSQTTTTASYQLKQNSCPDYVLLYCTAGKGQCETGTEVFSFEANQFLFLSPQQFFRFQADPKNTCSIYWLHFNGQMVDELKTNYDLQQFKTPAQLPFSDQVRATWQKIHSSLSEGFALENIGYANLNLYHLISLLLFVNNANKTSKTVNKNIQQDEDQLDQSIVFMKENLHKQLSVELIAKEFNYSSSHYSTLFKQKTGLSPIDYFIRLKIQYACQLLNKSNLIIKEISQKVGYEDPFYFSRIFKKITGKSPVEYKGGLKIKPALPKINYSTSNWSVNELLSKFTPEQTYQIY